MCVIGKYNQIVQQEENKNGKIRIVLINTPLDFYDNQIQPKYDTLFPFGILALSQIARKLGFATIVIDGEAARLSVGEIVSLIDEVNPEIIGINLLSPSITISASIIKTLNKGKRIIVGGGPHATYEPQDCFEKIPKLDYLFCGEATISWHTFLQYFEKSYYNRIEQIKGIMSQKSLRRTLGKRIESFDEILSVDRSLTIFPAYDKNGLRETSIFASVGCTHNCRFCAGRTLSGKKVRYRSLDSLMNEISHCVNQWGINAFHFADDDFLQNPEYLRMFVYELKKRRLSIHWRSFARVDSVTEETIELATESGCFRLTFGIESGNNRTLTHMGKGNTVDEAYQAINFCKTRGIETKSFFMLGYPDETEEEIYDTINFSINSNLDWAYFYLVRAFPGTALFQELIKLGFSRSELLEYIHWVPDMTNNLSKKQLVYKKIVEENGIFSVDSILKYNVAHKRSINLHLSNTRLTELMASAYSQFYYRKEFVDRQLHKANNC